MLLSWEVRAIHGACRQKLLQLRQVALLVPHKHCIKHTNCFFHVRHHPHYLIILCQSMHHWRHLIPALIVFLLFVPSSSSHNVTADGRSILIDGERVLLLSASIHYPRSPVSQWDNLLKKSKAAGINLIETYVFWARMTICCVLLTTCE